jgi:hypothetical protein
MDDIDIRTALAPLVPISLEDIPIEGDWLAPPFHDDPQGRAVILNDGDFQFVVVDRLSGAIYCVCEDDQTLVASSLGQLVQIAKLWGAIDRDAIGPEEDEEFARVAKDFERQLLQIDPAAAKPNEFWCLYADELSSSE